MNARRELASKRYQQRGWVAVFALALGLQACVVLQQLKPKAQSDTRLPIMQGVTGTDYTQVLVLTQDAPGYRFVLQAAQGKELSPAQRSVHEEGSSDWQMQHVQFNNLTPNTTYTLRVYRNGQLLDTRRLRTLDPRQRRVRFAVASCMNDRIPQGDIWQQMLALRPDVIFLIGDNTYADKYIKGVKFGHKKKQKIATPAELSRRHIETRNYIELFKSEELVPVVATWDDHDYGMNNGGSDYPYKRESLRIFNAFFASQPSAHYQRAGLGTAALFSMHGFSFFMLDNRSFRDVRYHYGDKQLQWLWKNMRGKDYAFLLGGDQFFGGYHRFESFEGNHRAAFTRFLAKLKTLPTKVAFVSGDRHIAEVMRIPAQQLGYQTYEFTSSPIHGKLYPGGWDKIPNPRQIASHDLKHNFMLLEVARAKGKLLIRAAAYGKGGELLFEGDYTVH